MGLRKTEATGFIGWVDQRLSIMDAWNTHLAQYWAPKNFNVWYFLRIARINSIDQPDSDRYLADDELRAKRRGCICFSGIYHARR